MAARRTYSKQPILVWTMGKVGSSTISYSLFMAGLYTLDIHNLYGPHVTQTSAGAPSQESNSKQPHHILRSRRVADLLESGTAPVEIITAVREPIGRNISAFFQNVKKSDVEGKPIQDLIALFKKKYTHSIPLTWFDSEILKGTGVDILAQPFDLEKGWSIHEEGRFRFLTIRLDGPKDAMSEGLNSFFGEPIHIASQNESRGKYYAKVYSDVKDTIVFDSADLSKAYSSRYAKTFWSPDELVKLEEHWSTPRQP